MKTQKNHTLSTPMKDQVCLTLRGLSKNFGGLEALSCVDLRVPKGERRAIIGPNGAGKTTLFNLVSGELPPTKGNILFFGRDITQVPAHKRAYLGIARTFQITNLFLNLAVADNVFLAAQALERTKFNILRPASTFRGLYDRVDEILAKVGMADKAKEMVKNLSYGEQRQLEVAMALLGDPRLLLLDEPTAGLAPAESALMVSVLKALSDALTILIIEHDMDVAFEISDSLTVLNHGRVLAEGTKEEIQSNNDVQKIYLKRR
jgi:branched-chain amino acid transport system ATP-binding protein